MIIFTLTAVFPFVPIAAIVAVLSEAGMQEVCHWTAEGKTCSSSRAR